MSSAMKLAIVVLLAGAVAACSQTTTVQQVLDPRVAPAPVADASLEEPADTRSTGAISVQKTGGRIFLVPAGSASPEPEPPLPN